MTRSFIIWYDKSLHLLEYPLHVYYCERSYDNRYNPNHAMIRLTQTINVLFRRPWYGSLVVVKFSSHDCTRYDNITIPDVVHVRDYFAYFA